MTLPSGWEWVAVGDLGTWRGGGTPSKSKPEYWSGDIPWVSAKDMKVLRLTDTEDHITSKGVAESSTTVVPAGTILLVTRSGILKHTLPVAVAQVPMAINQDLKALKVRTGILPEYVAWALRSFSHSILRTYTKSGTTVQSVEFGRFKDFRVPVAPLDEQQSIVLVIEEQFSRLDAADKYLHNANARLLTLRSSLVSKAMDEHWPGATIAEVTPRERPSAYGVLQPGGHVVGGVPLIRVADIVGGVVRTSDLKLIDPAIAARYPRTRLVGGEVVLTIVGTVGRTAVVPKSLAGANVARAVAVIPLDDSMNPHFVSLALSTPRSAAQLVGLAHEVARKTLNLEDVRRFRIPVPPRQSQDEVVEAVAARMSIADAVMQEVRQVSLRGRSAKNAILREVFKGGLRLEPLRPPRKQYRND